ncbi:hypothetical protein BDQ17DRAFT_414981 [Cyathus striatus]|nr:hypothetical protein BDQ17DRAFT_414981 [Cyathus striatus]
MSRFRDVSLVEFQKRGLVLLSLRGFLGRLVHRFQQYSLILPSPAATAGSSNIQREQPTPLHLCFAPTPSTTRRMITIDQFCSEPGRCQGSGKVQVPLKKSLRCLWGTAVPRRRGRRGTVRTAGTLEEMSNERLSVLYHSAHGRFPVERTRALPCLR